MSLKTCKTLQIIAVILFALAFAFCIASMPLKNSLVRLAYPEQFGEADDLSGLGIVPTISLITAAVHLGVSLVHITALFNKEKTNLLASVIVCCLIFLIYKLFAPSLNAYITNRITVRSIEKPSGYFNAYGMLENTVYGIIAFMLVPGSILMFLSLGGSLGGKREPATVSVAAEAAQPDSAAANTDAVQAAPKPAKKLKLPGLESDEPADEEESHAGFKKPVEASDGEQSKIDPEAYRQAFKKPKDTE